MSDQIDTFVFKVKNVPSVEWDIATYVGELRRKGYKKFTRTGMQRGEDGWWEVIIYAWR